MISTGLRAVFVLLAFAAPVVSGQTNPKDPNSYEALVERAKGGDLTVDFRQLRLAYWRTQLHGDSQSSREKTGTDAAEKAMMDALNNKDYPAAIKNAELVLGANYVNIDAHFVEFVAHRELNEPQLAGLHKSICRALIKSITDSGDGKTPQTAYEVICVHEEYVLLRILGLAPKKQSVLHENGHSYDVMICTDRQTNEEKTLYFNVDLPFETYGK